MQDKAGETRGEQEARELAEKLAAMSPAERRLYYIEQYGRLLFNREEIAIILGESGEDYDADTLAFLKGQLMSEAEVRTSILKSASTGSAPAQKQWMDLVMANRQRIATPPTKVEDMEPAKAVEHLARLQFTRMEITKIVGKPIEGDLLEVYKRAITLEEAKIREATNRLALQGNTSAQKRFAEHVAQAKKANIGL